MTRVDDGDAPMSDLYGLFVRACGLDEQAREEFLANVEAGDPGLLAQLRDLLAADDGGGAVPHDPEQAPLALPPEVDTTADTGSPLLERLAQHTPAESRYRELEEIAQGGMGAVLKIWDTDLRRSLAMKVILGDSADASDEMGSGRLLRSLFLEEAQITGQLQHPGIVPVHELGLDQEGRLFFTMPLVKGQTFREVIDWVHDDSSDWSLTRALGVLLDACEAMAYAHSRGVIHRDLKPQNVMVGQFGETYVMDWGVARILGQEDRHDRRILEPAASGIHTERNEAAASGDDSPLTTMDGVVLGTPAYMSPEQADGRQCDVDAQSDVYAIGAMLYHLLADRVPFTEPGEKNSPWAVVKRVVDGPPASVESVAPRSVPELVAICERAMARRSVDRYSSTTALARDLRAYLEHRVVRAYQTGPLVELRKWIDRNRALAGSVLLAAFLAVGGSATVAFVTRAKNREIEAQNTVLERKKAEAVALAEELLGYSDGLLIDELKAEALELWPRRQHMIGSYLTWLERARALSARSAEHRRVLTRLESTNAPDLNQSAGGLSNELRWRLSTVSKLVEAQEAFESLIEDIDGRLAVAQVQRATLIDGYRDNWEQAISDIETSETYDGLALEPLEGLVPIGQDPETLLWEFWHPESGDRPQRDERGVILPTDAMGLVFVLVPGGSTWTGSQDSNPAGVNYDPNREEDEPLHQMQIEPFWISKFELTQGQWQRLGGEDPSRFNVGNTELEGVTLLHPVEQVSWVDCQNLLFKFELALPRESQWEHAARAGTQTPWWTGPDRADLSGGANLVDAKYRTVFQSGRLVEPWSDGYGIHAPVGTFPANHFGLHDVLGNVSEWCAGPFAARELANQGDVSTAMAMSRSARLAGADEVGVFRGGGFASRADFARSADRGKGTRTVAVMDLGLRPIFVKAR